MLLITVANEVSFKMLNDYTKIMVILGGLGFLTE